MSTTPDHAQIDADAARFFDAVCAGDVDTLEQCLGPDFVAWHNTDNIWQDRTEHLATLAWLKSSISDLHYEEVVREPLLQGFLQQHVMIGSVRGTPLALRASVIATVGQDGRLISTREYIDSKQLRPLYQDPGKAA
ncbi:nuclear transport factor 2 family protein [Sphingobium sp.]|uniref:nuclear transport factor 2 family protein n=1 Tax=Sphingobium sp. TaxID=1912891 RepID=UPI003BB7F71B